MIVGLIIGTLAAIVASLWDAVETRRGIREGRLREGNVILRASGGLATGRKMALTGVPIGVGWVIYFTGHPGLAVACLFILAGVFAAVAIYARRGGYAN